MINNLLLSFIDISALLGIAGSALAFVLVFGLLVLIHELGHFSAAKFFKVKVEEFGIGLPFAGMKPTKLFKKGDTQYNFYWLPLGGFVRLYGEDDLTGKLANKKGSFSSIAVWKRIVIAAAGVIMNLILAFVLFCGLFWTGMRPLSIIPDNVYPFSEASYTLPSTSFAVDKGILKANPSFEPGVTINEIVEGSLAESVGLPAESKVLSLNDTTPETTLEFSFLNSQIPVGEEVTLILETKDGAEETFTFEKTSPKFGVYISSLPSHLPPEEGKPIPSYQFDALEVPGAVAKEMTTLTLVTFEAVGGLLGNIVSRAEIPDDIGGPVQVAQVIHQANTNGGLDMVILLAAILSINLAVFNILPIPALDGGRIVFLLYEGITRRKPNRKVEGYVHIIGYLFLVTLLILVTFKDIVKLITG